MSIKDLTDAKKLWSYVLDTGKYRNSKAGISQAAIRNIITDVSQTRFEVKKPREEVLLVARFIANIDPTYRNSQDDLIELKMLRTNPRFTEEDLQFLCEKIEETVKSHIMVTSKTELDGIRLKVETKMTKKKLIHAAVMHLLTGSEILVNSDDYNILKSRSALLDNYKVNYAWMIGLAIALEYDSVPLMMHDMCLKFVDQTETIEAKGQVVFYDGTIRTENL